MPTLRRIIENHLTRRFEIIGIDLLARSQELWDLVENSGEVNKDLRFSSYYGTWAFSGDIPNLIESLLLKAETPTAWKGLGEFYERAACFAIRHGGSEFDGCKSEDYLAFWAIRSYLNAAIEEKAIESLDKFGEHKDLVMPPPRIQKKYGLPMAGSPNLKLLYSLVDSAKKSAKESKTQGDLAGCSSFDRKFDLPALVTFPRFYQDLKRLQEKYLTKWITEF